MGFHNWIGCFQRELMFDVAPAFQTPRRKTARSRKPTPIHFKSSLTCRMSMTSAFVHWRLLKKFVVFSFYFTWDDFGFQTRLTTSRKPRAQKKCVKLLSLFLLGALARFGDSLPLYHSGHREGGKTDHRSVHDWSPQFQGAFGSFTLSVQTVDCPVVNCQLCCAGRQVGEGGGWCWDQPRHIEVHYLLLILYVYMYIYIYIYFVIFCHLTFDSRLMASNSVDCWRRKFRRNQGLIAMAFCSLTQIGDPTSRTLSSRDCWCLASFVEPLWPSLLDEAICISLQGSRSIVSPHVRTCWSNPFRCGSGSVLGGDNRSKFCF